MGTGKGNELRATCLVCEVLTSRGRSGWNCGWVKGNIVLVNSSLCW